MARNLQPNIPTTYDAVFKAAAKDDIPVSFLRALSYSESGLNTQAKPPPAANSSALGLFQIINATRKHFNDANKKNYTQEQMGDPAIGAEVGTWLIRTIAATYGANAPTALAMNWNDPRWVGLVCVGYVAGWNSPQGVAGIAKDMVRGGLPNDKITPATVIEMAGKLYPKSGIYVDPAKKDAKGLGPYMSDPELFAHADAIVARYFWDKEKRVVRLTPLPKPPPLVAAKNAVIRAAKTPRGKGVAIALAGLGLGFLLIPRNKG